MKYLSIIFILIFRLSAFAQVPDWSVNPNEYEYSMSFSGVVSIDTAENTNTSSKIAAWVNGELRGTADPVYVTATGRYYYLLLVYANTVGETIEFTFYDADTDQVVDIIKEETFVSDKNIGSFSDPYLFKNWENYQFNEFALAGFEEEAEIDATGKQISFTLPANTDPTSLVVVFQFDDATSIKVKGVEQESGVTANNFTAPVEYVVTTPNNTHTWTVNVTVEEIDEEENDLFNVFSFAGFDATAEIDATGKQIAFTLPANTDPTSLVAVFQFDDATSIKVNGVEQESGVTANNFSAPVEYVVTTPNNTHTWTVHVTVEEINEEENDLFNEFSFAGFDATAEIDATGKQIAFTLPANTDPTNLVAVFRFDDATSIKVNGVEQESGVTTNNFTAPVEYVVTTPNNTHTWTVNVTIEESEEEPTITGIEDGESDPELVLYPNPAQDKLNIKSSSKVLVYEIFNNCGILTLRGELSSGIDVKDLPTGMYFIRITTENDDILVKRWLKD